MFRGRLEKTRAGSLAVRRGFLTLTLPLSPTLSHSLTLSLSHSLSLLMTFGTIFILIPKLKSCILTY